MGLAFWQPLALPKFNNINARPTWMTYVVDGSVALDTGQGRLFAYDSTETQKFTVPSKWSLGVSLGWVGGYSTHELFGRWVKPDPATDALLVGAATTCELECAADSKAKGCDVFNAYRTGIVEMVETRWFLDEIIAGTDDAGTIVARMSAKIPGSTDGCTKAKQDWQRRAQNFVDGRGKRKALLKLTRQYAAAFEPCEVSCSGPDCPVIEASKVEFEPLTKPNFRGYPPRPDDQLCATGAQVVRSASAKNPAFRQLEAARYQKYTVAFGGGLGFSPHKFLSVDEGALQPLDDNDMPVGDPVDALTDRSQTWMIGQAGASAAGLWLNGFTLEGRALYGRASKDQTTQGQWCTSAGVVGDSLDDPAARSCKTRPLGAPKVTNSFAADVRFGYADLRRGVFRVAGGPRYAIQAPDGGPAKHSLGLHVPLYLNLLAAPRNNEKLDYDGLIRITPFFDVTLARDDGQFPMVAGISFSLLGRRSLFSTKYDEL